MKYFSSLIHAGIRVVTLQKKYMTCIFTYTRVYKHTSCLSVGAWCTADVKQGSLFGPFKGEIVKENERKKIDFRYAWEVSSS